MKRILIALLLICTAVTAHSAPATIVTGSKPSPLEMLAARELQKYLHGMTGRRLPIATSADGDAFAVGTPASNPLVRRLGAKTSDLGDQGYLLRTVRDGKRKVLIVTGNTPNAVMYGVYSLLEEYGCGFYLGGDAIPSPKPFAMPDLNVSREPVFKVRGVLPWYNFFNSPTAWDYEDYVWFFDQLAKAKNNFIGFHAYDAEPFCAYKENGKYVMGEPLSSTKVPCWGSYPMTTSEFGYGTAKYFDKPYFGAKPSLYRDDREKSIRDAQDLLKRAFGYAHARGLKTCLGFEVSSLDPTNPAQIEILEKRLKHIVAQYPTLDYIWIWEPEAWGLGTDPQPLDSDMGAYYRHYDKAFSYLKDSRQRCEAIRMTVYAEQAHRILQASAPRVRLVVSGWGGDERLHSADFYPGMDKVLPKGIIFASLDHISMRDRVDAGYALSKGRERWPIPWYECDGDQWMPQPNAKECLNSCRDALKKGCQGMLAIHWRSRDVEESHAMMSQFSWNPTMTYEGFYRSYAQRCFGSAHAAEIAPMLMELQSLAWRWTGGSGQSECGSFDWGSPGDPSKIKRLHDIYDKLRTIRMAMLVSAQPLAPYSRRLDYLMATIRWAVQYDKAVCALSSTGTVTDLLTRARAAKEKGNTQEASRLATDGLRRLSDCRFDLAMQDCARRVTNRGELGILATVNAKAYYALRSVERELLDMSGRKSSPTSQSPCELPDTPASGFSPVNPNDIWCAGSAIPVKVVTHSDGCSVRAIVRLGDGAKQQATMLRMMADRYFEGSISCPASGPTTVEYTLQLLDPSGRVVDDWPGNGRLHAVTVIPPIADQKAPAIAKPAIPVPVNVRARPVPTGSILVAWDGPSGVYEVRRAEGDGQFKTIRVIGAKWIEDSDIKEITTYRYEVRGAGRQAKGIISSPVAWTGRIKLPTPVVTATSGPARVRLRWQKSVLGTLGYQLMTGPSESGPWNDANSDLVKPNFWSEVSYALKASPGASVYYKVLPVDRWGNPGPASNVVHAQALAAGELPQILAADFSSDLHSGSWEASPNMETMNGVPTAHFQRGNSIIFPHRAEFNPPDELTISMWAKLESPGQIPVLLCHGAFSADGYFVQVLGKTLRFYLQGAGALDAGEIEAGKWYHIVCTYDGQQMVSYLNGRQIAQLPAGPTLVPCNRNLYIGRYDMHGSEWETDCRLADVRIYSVALLPDEVAKEYARLADKLR